MIFCVFSQMNDNAVVVGPRRPSQQARDTEAEVVLTLSDKWRGFTDAMEKLDSSFQIIEHRTGIAINLIDSINETRRRYMEYQPIAIFLGTVGQNIALPAALDAVSIQAKLTLEAALDREKLKGYVRAVDDAIHDLNTSIISHGDDDTLPFTKPVDWKDMYVSGKYRNKYFNVQGNGGSPQTVGAASATKRKYM